MSPTSEQSTMVLRSPSGMIHYRLADLNMTYCGRSVPPTWQRIDWDDLPQSAVHCERCWPHRGKLSGQPDDLMAALEASLAEIPHRPWSAPRAAESTGEASPTMLAADAAPRVPAGAGLPDHPCRDEDGVIRCPKCGSSMPCRDYGPGCP